MRQPLIFLIIIFAFTGFAYLSIQQIYTFHQSSSSMPDTVIIHPNITDDFAYYITFADSNLSEGLNFVPIVDSVVIKYSDTSNFKKDITKVIYNIHVSDMKDGYETFRTYTATQATSFAAKVNYPKINLDSSAYYENLVVTALIYLKNGDIKIPRQYIAKK